VLLDGLHLAYVLVSVIPATCGVGFAGDVDGISGDFGWLFGLG